MMSSASKPSISRIGILKPRMMSFTVGIPVFMSSGVACLVALYSLKISSRKVLAEVSNAIPMCVGFCFWMTSSNVLVNPNGTEVLCPFELMRGFLVNAKCARYINAYASRRKSFLEF